MSWITRLLQFLQASRLHEPREVVEVQVVGSITVGESIDTDDGVEDFRGERQ